MAGHQNSDGHNLIGRVSRWLLVGMVGIQSIATTYALELPQDQIAFYLRISLSNSNGVVSKFSQTGPLAMQSVCATTQRDTCNKAALNKRIGDSFGSNNRLNVQMTLDTHRGSASLVRSIHPIRPTLLRASSLSLDELCHIRRTPFPRH
jgi:hypothetical protein